MDIEYKKNREEENPTLAQQAEGDNDLKRYLVEYTGNKTDPESGEVTVDMIINALSVDFPELILALAEENFIRGYQQAFSDIEVTSKGLFESEKENE
jgi:hypothetical protein